MYCPQCGSEIPYGAQMCPFCGLALSTQTSQPVREEVSLSDWIVTMLITAIPVVGFIMLFVWAFGSAAPPSKRNWAKAALIWMAIGVVLGSLLGGAIAGFLANLVY